MRILNLRQQDDDLGPMEKKRGQDQQWPVSSGTHKKCSCRDEEQVGVVLATGFAASLYADHEGGGVGPQNSHECQEQRLMAIGEESCQRADCTDGDITEDIRDQLVECSGSETGDIEDTDAHSHQSVSQKGERALLDFVGGDDQCQPTEQPGIDSL